MWTIYWLAALGAVTLAISVCVWLTELHGWVCDKVENWRRETGVRYMLRKLTQDAEWFNEDPATRNLLICLAEGKPAIVCRDRWIADKASEAQKSPKDPTEMGNV